MPSSAVKLVASGFFFFLDLSLCFLFFSDLSTDDYGLGCWLLQFGCYGLPGLFTEFSLLPTGDYSRSGSSTTFSF